MNVFFLVLLTFLSLKPPFSIWWWEKLPRSLGPLVSGGVLDGTAVRSERPAPQARAPL